MERLDPGQLWVLCAQDWEVPARAGFRSLSLDSLRKGGSRREPEPFLALSIWPACCPM